ncbi:hypothetical protein SLA2020_268660 [Shorea laevis]
MAAHTLSKLPTTTTSSTSSTSLFSNFSTRRRPQSLPHPWLGTTNISLQSSNLRPHVLSKHRPIAASVLSSLPTANPERFSSAEKVPKWSRKAIKSFAMGNWKRGSSSIQLLGLKPFSWGFSLRELVLLQSFCGRMELHFSSPEHPPLTEGAQRTLDWAVDQKLKTGDDGEITTSHLLLGIWSEVESPGHKIMATFGFNDEKVKELESLSSESGFADD